ncbi:MAG: TIGR01459 family HAD-type hydrolase [Candidatus Symbiobacter sp.]|nr:TIGR01459 family HAD-type hydrolase [Candidatus Symbiobacter sp.]
MQYFPGVREFYQQYDAFLLDIWGVLHDGSTAYAGAIEAMRQLHQAGKVVILLSNAPRPSFEVYPVLDKLGFSQQYYDFIQTSGQEVWEHLRDRSDPWYRNLGENIYLLGPMKDSAMVVGIQGRQVAHLEAADVVLATGMESNETLADYENLLRQARQFDLPMICANPDIIVIHDGVIQYCAGSMAARYLELGGEVRYHGKPHLSIYQSAFRRAAESLVARGLVTAPNRRDAIGAEKNVSRETMFAAPHDSLWLEEIAPQKLRIAAIGDGLATDITGANSAKIDSFFVLGGIHGQDFAAHGFDAELRHMPPLELVRAYCHDRQAIPTGILPRFVW